MNTYGYSIKNEAKNIKFVYTLLLIALILILSILVSFTKAQTGIEGQSLEVSPPSQDLTANPGDTILVKSRVRNRSNKTLSIDVRLEDFVATGVEGQIALTEKGPWAISNWAGLSDTSFSLDPNEAREVIATVNIPSSGAAGGRYGSFVYAVRGASTGPGVAALSQEIASLFLIDIAGVKEEKLDITSFLAPKFLEFGPVKFDLTFKNTGNVHLRPHGVIAIFNPFGKKIADVTLIGTNVFPQAERQISVNWDKKWLFGQYSAEAIINSGGTKNTGLNASTTFIVFPIRIAAAIIIVLIALYLLRRRIFKALKVLAGK